MMLCNLSIKVYIMEVSSLNIVQTEYTGWMYQFQPLAVKVRFEILDCIMAHSSLLCQIKLPHALNMHSASFLTRETPAGRKVWHLSVIGWKFDLSCAINFFVASQPDCSTALQFKAPHQSSTLCNFCCHLSVPWCWGLHSSLFDSKETKHTVNPRHCQRMHSSLVPALVWQSS